MHVQPLSSGSEGNATLVRCGELSLLVDAGLKPRELAARFEAARVTPRMIDHVFVTHAHLDHARSAGIIGKKQQATVHCAEGMMRFRALARASKLAALRIGHETEIAHPTTDDRVSILPVPLPHDCDPTVAFRIAHRERVFCVLTDMGEPRRDVAERLRGAHVLQLEFNYDPELLERGPYSPALKERIRGGRGHLSNDEAATMLEWMAGPELHTLFVAHVSQRNNTHELALECARAKLSQLGLDHVEARIASQHEIGPNVAV